MTLMTSSSSRAFFGLITSQGLTRNWERVNGWTSAYRTPSRDCWLSCNQSFGPTQVNCGLIKGFSWPPPKSKSYTSTAFQTHNVARFLHITTERKCFKFSANCCKPALYLSITRSYLYCFYLRGYYFLFLSEAIIVSRTFPLKNLT